MSISVVQFVNIGSSWTGNLNSAATVGNTLFYCVGIYGVNPGDSTSNPQYGGSTFTGAVELWSVQSVGGGPNMYSSCWMLPNIQSSATSVSITEASGSPPSPDGALIVLEVAGLGKSPALDQVVTANAQNGNASIGPTGSTQYAPEFVIEHSAIYGNYPSSGPSSPWTNISAGNFHAIASWQVANIAATTYSWLENGNGNAWAGGLATIRGTIIPPVLMTASYI